MLRVVVVITMMVTAIPTTVVEIPMEGDRKGLHPTSSPLPPYKDYDRVETLAVPSTCYYLCIIRIPRERRHNHLHHHIST
jgi:hypothetical protein